MSWQAACWGCRRCCSASSPARPRSPRCCSTCRSPRSAAATPRPRRSSWPRSRSTIFSVGYIAMARRVTSAGGFYTFVSRGLGRVAGLGVGYLIALCYIIFSAAVLGVTSYFASTTVATITGVDLPAWVYMIIGLVLVSLFAWFHIELTAKVLGVLLIGEVLVLVGDGRRDLRRRRGRGPLARAAQPGEHLRQLGRGRGVRRRRRGHRALRRVLVVGRVRDGAQLRRGDPRPAQDRQDRDVRLGDRPRRLLRDHVLRLRHRLGPHRLGERGEVASTRARSPPRSTRSPTATSAAG